MGVVTQMASALSASLSPTRWLLQDAGPQAPRGYQLSCGDTQVGLLPPGASAKGERLAYRFEGEKDWREDQGGNRSPVSAAGGCRYREDTAFPCVYAQPLDHVLLQSVQRPRTRVDKGTMIPPGLPFTIEGRDRGLGCPRPLPWGLVSGQSLLTVMLTV